LEPNSGGFNVLSQPNYQSMVGCKKATDARSARPANSGQADGFIGSLASRKLDTALGRGA